MTILFLLQILHLLFFSHLSAPDRATSKRFNEMDAVGILGLCLISEACGILPLLTLATNTIFIKLWKFPYVHNFQDYYIFSFKIMNIKCLSNGFLPVVFVL